MGLIKNLIVAESFLGFINLILYIIIPSAIIVHFIHLTEFYLTWWAAKALWGFNSITIVTLTFKPFFFIGPSLAIYSIDSGYLKEGYTELTGLMWNAQ